MTPNFPVQSLQRKIELDPTVSEVVHRGLQREWLVTNGLGGYASGTLAGAVSWRYHGLLIAALPSPIGRTTMLNHLAEALYFPNRQDVQFGGSEPADPNHEAAANYLVEFKLDNQLPCWRYDVNGVVLEKHLL